MILVAGLSPAWQQILQFETFRAGEVNRASDAVWCASGKVLNVGIALAHLQRGDSGDRSGGHPGCHLLSTLGGRAWAPIDEELAALGVERTWIRTAAPTRICTSILDRASGATTELVENASPITVDEWREFLAAYQRLVKAASLVVLTGSLPPGAPTSAYRQLLELSDCAAVLDVRGPELLAALPAGPLVVKPNLEELLATLRESSAAILPAGERRRGAMRELRDRGAQWVLATDGPRGASIAGPEGDFCCQPPTIEPVNPIGSGDCLAAGMAWRLAQGDDVLAALRFGIAAAVENALNLLPGRLEAAKVAERAAAIEVIRGLP